MGFKTLGFLQVLPIDGQVGTATIPVINATQLNCSSTVIGSDAQFVTEEISNTLSVTNGATVGTLDVKSTALIEGAFTVSGASQVQQLNATSIVVSGNTSTATLNVTNSATINSLAASTSNLTNITSSGTAQLTTLNVTGTTTAANINATQLNSSGTITATGLLGTNSTVDVANNTAALYSGGGLYVPKSAQIVNTATVGTLAATTANVANALTVSGASNLATVTSSGLATLNSLSVTGTSSLNTLTTTGNEQVGGNLQVTGTMNITGASQVGTLQSSSLTVNGPSTLLGNTTTTGLIQVNNTTDVNSAGTAASVTTAGGLIVSKQLLAGNTTVGSLAASSGSISGPFGVVGATTLSSAQVANLSVSGSITNTGSETISGLLTATGGLTTPGPIILTPLTLTSATASTPTVQGGSNVALNAFRIRTSDTTNTSARMSIANTAMANSYYDSGISIYNLGSSEASTNYERLSYGINTAGGYLNYLYGGTGVARPFNLFGGSVFSTGGALQLASTLGVTGALTGSSTLQIAGASTLAGLSATTGAFSGALSGSSTLQISGASTLAGVSATTLQTSNVVTINSTSDVSTSTPANTSLFTAGGLYVTLQSYLKGLVTTGGGINNPGALTQSGNLTGSGLWSNTNTTDAAGGTTPSASVVLGGGQYITKSLLVGTTLGVSGASTLALVSATSINNSGTETVAGLLTANGGITTTGPLNNSGTETITGLLTANGGITTTGPVTLPSVNLTSATASTPTVQGGSNVALNAFRIRTSDTTNTSARMSIANTAMANSYYDSGISIYNLGSSEASTNFERISYGINSTGGYLNYLYGGTGVARPFNLFGGSVFSTGGSLQLASTLGVSGALTGSSTLQIAGASTLAGLSATTGAFSGALSGSSTLQISGTSTLAGVTATNVQTSGVVTINSTSDVSTSTPANTSFFTAGGAYVTLTSYLKGLLTTAGGITNLGTLAQSGALTGSGLWTNTNTTDASGGSTPAASVLLSGGQYISKSLLVGTTLGVTGAITGGSTLNIAGTSTLAGVTVTSLNNSGAETVSGLFTANGGITTTGPVTNNGTETIGGVLAANGGITTPGPITFPALTLTSVTSSAPTVQGGSNIALNVLRMRTADTTNTSARMNIANTAMGNSYYDSGFGMYNLGSSETSTNYERVSFGINSSGGYLNYLYGGTGVARPFNLLGGSVFSTGGALQLASTLGVTGALTGSSTLQISGASTLGGVTATNVQTSGVVTINSTSDVSTSTPANTSLFTAGGAYVTLTSYLKGLLTTAGGITNLGTLIQSGALTGSGLWTNTNTTDASGGSTPAASVLLSGGQYISKSLLIGTTLGVTGAITGGSTLNVTGTSTLAGVNATSVTNSGTETITGLLTANGGITTSGPITNSGAETITGLLTANGGITTPGPFTLPVVTLTSATSSAPTVQGGSNVALNVLRVRTADTTNTSARLSIANTAMTNSYYDSGIAMYNLGSSETSTNYERLSFGINSAGGYLNYLYGGTGVARTFNLFGGSVFGTGGSLQLASTLGVTGASTLAALAATTASFSGAISGSSTLAVTGTSTLAAVSATTGTLSGVLNVNSTADVSTSTPANTSVYTAGGAYVTLTSYLKGLVTAAAGINDLGTLQVGGATTLSSTLGVSGASTLAAVSATTGTLSGVLNVNSTADVSTSTPANTSLYTAGGAYVTLTSYLKGLVTAAAGINDLGTLQVGGATTLSSTLGVSGASTLAAVSATTATLSGVLNVNSTADVSTSTPANTSVYTAGGAYVILTSYLKGLVTAAAGINDLGTLQVGGATTLSSTLGVSGASTLAAVSATTGTLSGVLNVNSTADVSTSTPANTSVYTAGGAYVTLTSYLKGLVTTPGGITNSGTLNQTGPFTGSGIWTNTNTTDASGGSTPAGSVVLSGGQYIAKSLLVGTTLGVTGAITGSSTLNISGTSTLAGTTTTSISNSGTLTQTGNSTCAGYVNITNTGAATSTTTSSAALQVAGGVAVAADLYANTVQCNTIYQIMTYVNSTQTISNNTLTSLAVNLATTNTSSSKMTSALAVASGTANVFTVPYSGIWSIRLSLRVSPTQAGASELIILVGNSATYGSTNTRIEHTKIVTTGAAAITLSVNFIGYLESGATITPTLFYVYSSVNAGTMGVVSGNDCLYCAVLLMRQS